MHETKRTFPCHELWRQYFSLCLCLSLSLSLCLFTDQQSERSFAHTYIRTNPALLPSTFHPFSLRRNPPAAARALPTLTSGQLIPHEIVPFPLFFFLLVFLMAILRNRVIWKRLSKLVNISDNLMMKFRKSLSLPVLSTERR